jgi:TctA family transporter
LLVVIAALALYPLALGIGAKDPYRLGYGDPWFLLVLLAIALAAISRRLPVVALVVPLAVLAWGVGWYESTNLWDYLLDPLVAIYGVGVLMKLLARQLRLVRQPARK